MMNKKKNRTRNPDNQQRSMFRLVEPVLNLVTFLRTVMVLLRVSFLTGFGRTNKS